MIRCRHCGREITQHLGEVRVGVLMGTNLGNSGVQAYCKIHLGNQAARTKVAGDATKPRWEEEFSFRLTDASQKVDFQVLLCRRSPSGGSPSNSASTANSDTLLGRFTLPLNQLAPQDRRKFLVGFEFRPGAARTAMTGYVESGDKLERFLRKRRSVYMDGSAQALEDLDPIPYLLIELNVLPNEQVSCEFLCAGLTYL